MISKWNYRKRTNLTLKEIEWKGTLASSSTVLNCSITRRLAWLLSTKERLKQIHSSVSNYWTNLATSCSQKRINKLIRHWWPVGKQLKVYRRWYNLSTIRANMEIWVKIPILLILRHTRKHKPGRVVIRNGISIFTRQSLSQITRISLTTKPAGMRNGRSSRTSFAVQTTSAARNLTRLRLNRLQLIIRSEFDPKRSRLPQVRGTRENYSLRWFILTIWRQTKLSKKKSI